MTASFAIEAGVLGAASVLGVSKLYDMEKHATRWPDSAVAFAMLIGWLATAVFTLSASLLALRGVEVPGSKWMLVAVVSLTFLHHSLKRAGLLKTTVLDQDQERDPHASVHAVGRAGFHRPDQ